MTTTQPPIDTITFMRGTWEVFEYWYSRDAENDNVTDPLSNAWDELKAVAPPAQVQESATTYCWDCNSEVQVAAGGYTCETCTPSAPPALREAWKELGAVAAPAQVQESDKPLSRYGPQCCHKTVLSRCKGCPYDVTLRTDAASQPPAVPAGHEACVMSPMPKEDGIDQGWYFQHPEFYANAEKDADGDWMIYFFDKKSGQHTYAEHSASQPPAVQGVPAELTDWDILDMAELEGIATFETGWWRMTQGGLLEFSRALLKAAAPQTREQK